MPSGLFTAYTVAVEFSAGVWTALTGVVGDSIEIRVGRESVTSDVQPGVLTFTLDNSDGRYTPDNPTSTLYPNWIEGKRIRVQTVVSGTTYTRFVGRITRIEPDFPTEPQLGRVAVTATDLLGDLQRVKMRQWGVDKFARSAAPYMWVLDDKLARAGAKAVSDDVAKLTVRRTATSGKMDFAAVGDLDVDGSQFVQMTSGRGLWHAQPGFSVDLNATTFGGYFQLTEGSYGTIFIISDDPIDSPAPLNYVLVEYDASGIRLRAPSGTSSYITPPDFGWLRIACGLTLSNYGLTVASVETGTATSTSASGPPNLNVSRIGIGGSMTLAAARFYIGRNVLSLDDPEANVYGTAAEVSTEFILGSGLDSLGGTLVEPSYLDGYTTPQSLGRSAFEVLLDIARTHTGLVYQQYSTSATQTIEIVGNDRPTTVSLTVDAELDAVEGPGTSRRIDDYVASATSSNSITSKTVYDTTIGNVVGAAGIDIPNLTASDTRLKAIAQNALARGRDQHLRLSQVTVDLVSAVNNLYAAFYAVTPGARVRLSNLPSTYFGVTYMDGYVEGWTERPGVSGYEVTFDLSPADAPPEGRWDDSTYGRWGWGDGVCTLSSGITSGATSLTLTWTGTAALSTTAGDYPLDIDLNGERVTITSAPAGGTSPQTVSVTRGVAPTVARAHSAGEPIDIWNALRWAK